MRSSASTQHNGKRKHAGSSSTPNSVVIDETFESSVASDAQLSTHGVVPKPSTSSLSADQTQSAYLTQSPPHKKRRLDQNTSLTCTCCSVSSVGILRYQKCSQTDTSITPALHNNQRQN